MAAVEVAEVASARCSCGTVYLLTDDHMEARCRLCKAQGRGVGRAQPATGPRPYDVTGRKARGEGSQRRKKGQRR